MEFENTSRTELSELGEFGLIKHLTQHVQLHQQSTIKGVGDDAAVIEYDNKQTVITTDMLVEGVHFDLTYVPLKHLGYKSVMVNLSDLLAMNAKPQQILVSIAISNRFSLEAIEELYAGMLLACNKHAIDLIGGDTTSSRSGLVISITAIGSAEKNKIVYRNKAKENDLLCISGDLGGAYMGLQILEREKAVFKDNPNLQPDLTGKDYILERQLKPEARFDVIDLFEKINLQPTAMIDVSDGLSSEILHIVTQSEVGVDLYEEKIPIDTETYETAREFNLDPTMCALNGGEDYELLFTISMGDYEKIKNKNLVSVIGHITAKEKGYNMIAKDGTVQPIQAQGWNALSRKK
jgi:thiamine-monophosphate kinase